MNETRTTPPKIMCGTISLQPYRENTCVGVYLDCAGRIGCEDLLFPDDRQRNYRSMYGFCLEYLQGKGLEPNISAFRRKELNDIVSEMSRRNLTSITIEELTDIRDKQNELADISDAVLTRARSFVMRRWRQQLKRK